MKHAYSRAVGAAATANSEPSSGTSAWSNARVQPGIWAHWLPAVVRQRAQIEVVPPRRDPGNDVDGA